MQARAQQGDTLDAICWRHYGRTAGVTERVLEANRDLAALGPVIPTGHVVELPTLPAAATAAKVQLWD
ncbi:MAG TPA: tail protein X [Plasticicumulans sp.]|uniref:tail protein X n=1 Tax=Plasticicumulans sp. TaxID=2307179 RepID=UPI002C84AA3E|nr:tail protein X [Rhodocyclaceae bacterium]HMZ10771.1 tail protein X [Plasticicumulans sp.]